VVLQVVEVEEEPTLLLANSIRVVVVAWHEILESFLGVEVASNYLVA
jgi:hypothetical protein